MNLVIGLKRKRRKGGIDILRGFRRCNLIDDRLGSGEVKLGWLGLQLDLEGMLMLILRGRPRRGGGLRLRVWLVLVR